jgi:NADH-quinone oxidoreductase subunit D
VKPAAGAGSNQKKVVQDLPEGFVGQTLAAIQDVVGVCDDMEDLVLGNEIFLERTKGVGIIPADKALAYGVSGPNLRASGVRFDIRKTDDYLPYDRFDFDIPAGESGDCFDRYWVRLQEIREASKIIRQAVETMPSGDLLAKVPRIIKVPKGEVYVRAENPKGEMGYHVVSEGGRGPYRLKIRSASFSNLSVLPWLLKGQLVPDVIAILGSLDFVLGDVDR